MTFKNFIKEHLTIILIAIILILCFMISSFVVELAVVIYAIIDITISILYKRNESFYLMFEKKIDLQTKIINNRFYSLVTVYILLNVFHLSTFYYFDLEFAFLLYAYLIGNCIILFDRQKEDYEHGSLFSKNKLLIIELGLIIILMIGTLSLHDYTFDYSEYPFNGFYFLMAIAISNIILLRKKEAFTNLVYRYKIINLLIFSTFIFYIAMVAYLFGQFTKEQYIISIDIKEIIIYTFYFIYANFIIINIYDYLNLKSKKFYIISCLLLEYFFIMGFYYVSKTFLYIVVYILAINLINLIIIYWVIYLNNNIFNLIKRNYKKIF